MKRVVLVLEGGAAKIPIQIGVLQVVEKKLSGLIRDNVDLFVSTSAGTVNASILCYSDLWCSEYAKILLENIPEIFHKRCGFPKCRFSTYTDLYHKYVGSPRFGEAKKPTIFTTVNLLTGINTFVKSDHLEEGLVPMVVQACKSFAAPYYFGAWDDSGSKQVFLDGGIGFCGLPLIEAYTEAVKRGWMAGDNHVHILAVGCGRRPYGMSYQEAMEGKAFRRTLRQVNFYLDFEDGGLSRAQSTMYQVNTVTCLAKYTPNLSFQWIDWPNMPKDLDKFDNVKAREIYYTKGLEIGEQVDIKPLQERG